uniref:F-box domain-containing protein n=1 Tax=Kalanchoe fedtschenkoi TaxID=63787 RepID=A0A7N0VJD1_KALFE
MDSSRRRICDDDEADDERSGSPNLPNELLTEILVRLPVKSLSRFKCCSKQWCSLISSDDFIDQHLQQTQERCRLLALSDSVGPDNLRSVLVSSIYSDPANPEFVYVDPPISAQPILDAMLFYFQIDLSCNGLVLVRSAALSEYLVWNPTIRELESLPPIPLPDSELNYIGLLEPAIGFGYDEANKDYKVVAPISLSSPDEMPLERIYMMYSSRPKAWRKINVPDKYHILSDSSCPQQLYGALHWLSYTYDNHVTILSFELAADELHEIPTPWSQFPEMPYMKLWKYEGHLSIVMANQMGTVYNVWGMKGYLEKNYSWRFLFTIPMFPATFRFPSPDLLWHSSNGQLLLIQYNSFWAMLDTKSGALRTIPSFEDGRRIRKGIYYVESLVSPSAI